MFDMTASAGRAPELFSRRLVRVYAYPWAQFVVTTALAIWSWHLQVNLLPIIAWWFITLAAFIIEDLAAHESVLLNMNSWLRGKLGLSQGLRSDFDTATLFYSEYTRPRWYAQGEETRIMAAWAIVLSTWFYAVGIGRFTPAYNPSGQISLVTWLLLFPIVPFSVTLVARFATDHEIGRRLGLMILAASLIATFLSLQRLAFSRFDLAFNVALVGITYFSAYVAKRLWTGESISNDVLQDVSLTLLDSNGLANKDAKVAQLISESFRYDRVYLLYPAEDPHFLRVGDCFGHCHNIKDQLVPISKSITGKAFELCEPVMWNKTEYCPYYYEVSGLVDTRSEIAVPITHQGEVFAVLDVQSTRPGVFSRQDVAALESIALVLGAATATDQKAAFFREANELWQRLAEDINDDFSDVQGAAQLIAEFAIDQLGANSVVYFPLTITGRPIDTPYLFGDFLAKDRIGAPAFHESSSLIQRIDRWEPVFVSDLTQDAIHLDSVTPGQSGFVEREKLRSSCFIPIGRKSERLGAMYVNFREPVEFDMVFRFTILSLAQTMATLASEIRSRELYSKGFGRPELNLHAIVNRHQFNNGGIYVTAKRQLEKFKDGTHTLADCPLGSLIQDLDLAFREMTVAEAAIPPDFWGRSLETELDDFGRSLSHDHDGRRPNLEKYIDDKINRESPPVRLALYRIITEAVANAVVHANADNIIVRVSREPMEIMVQIENDGSPLPPRSREDAGGRGIFGLMRMCNAQLGAEDHDSPFTLEDKTIVKVSIPALPFRVMKTGATHANVAYSTGS